MDDDKIDQLRKVTSETMSRSRQMSWVTCADVGLDNLERQEGCRTKHLKDASRKLESRSL